MAARFRQTRAANLYPDKPSAVDASRSARDLFYQISHFLAELWCLSVVFLVAVLHRRLRSRQRGSTFVERHGSPSAGPSQRVLPVFIRALRKTFQPSLASLSASAPGVITTANRSAVALSQRLTTPFADPFAGLEDRNLRDAESYTEKTFLGQS